MVDNVKNYQSQIVVLNTSQQVVVSLSFPLLKNSTFQCSSFYVVHFTYKFIYVFVLQFYDPNLVVQFMYIKSAFNQQIEQVSTFRISSSKNHLWLTS